MAENINDNTNKILAEILKWIKFEGVSRVKEVLITELNNDVKKLVYQLSDGEHNLGEISDTTGASAGAISGYWKKWANIGLGDRLSVKGGDRFKRSFDLEDFDITIPKIIPSKNKNNPSNIENPKVVNEKNDKGLN